MAIDTREKRQSVVGISFYCNVGVTPNLAKDLQWRAEVAWGYPGLFADSGSAFWTSVSGMGGMLGGDIDTW